jgi:flagellar hook-length control protein FliK
VSDTLFNGLGKTVEAVQADRAESDKKNTLEQAKRWALVVGAQVSHFSPPASDMETSAWRASGGDMTPTNVSGIPAGAAESGSGEAAKNDDSRMILRVDAGDLGEVALLVDRRDGVMRVTIGVQGSAAEAAVEVERGALLQALQNVGIAVGSVNIARGANFGTVLAPPRNSKPDGTPDNSESATTQSESERRRLSRKLNLIG